MAIEKQAAEQIARGLVDVLEKSADGSIGETLQNLYSGMEANPLRSGLVGAGIGAGLGGLGMGLRSYLQGNSRRLALLDAGMGAGMGAGVGGIAGALPGLLSPKSEAIQDLTELSATRPDEVNLMSWEPGAWLKGGLGGLGLQHLVNQRAEGAAIRDKLKKDLPSDPSAPRTEKHKMVERLARNKDMGHGWYGWMHRKLLGQPVDDIKAQKWRDLLGDPLERQKTKEIGKARTAAKPGIAKSKQDFESARQALRTARKDYNATAKQDLQQARLLKQRQQEAASRRRAHRSTQKGLSAEEARIRANIDKLKKMRGASTSPITGAREEVRKGRGAIKSTVRRWWGPLLGAALAHILATNQKADLSDLNEE